MAFCAAKLLRFIRGFHVYPQRLLLSTTSAVVKTPKEYKTETDFVYLEDPDKFGTLSFHQSYKENQIEDEGDIQEEKHLSEHPVLSHKLTIRQYADLIKQYLKYKRLKEAIDILEVRMLNVDKVRPENYIYNILIGACADVGYTKKAFQLFNDMKRRALKPTGDTYTCLFQACTNSPWPADGLKRAQHLRSLMIEKGIEPNITNYNSMIKAFGRCGDLKTAFKIVDEMIAKKIKIRVHTFNHLLQACISDKESGLRHALIVWRKMLKLREKPNIYSFNLMLKCVKDCNLGTKEDIEDLVTLLQQQNLISNMFKNKQIQPPQLQICATVNDEINEKAKNEVTLNKYRVNTDLDELNHYEIDRVQHIESDPPLINDSQLRVLDSNNEVSIEFLDKTQLPSKPNSRAPNLLSRELQLEQVLSLREIQTLQDKFAVVGGLDDFLEEMKMNNVKPDIKVFTQMLPLLEENRQVEMKLLETIKSLEVGTDIDFYNMLIKKRCLRSDYEGAFEIKDIIEKEAKRRKRKHPLKKKIHLKQNVMTYGVLAMACKTKENAEKLLEEMQEKQLKVNSEILGTLLRQGTANDSFEYILFILNVVKEEKLNVNNIFIKHLETFNDKCQYLIKINRGKEHPFDMKSYKKFNTAYTKWLKEINLEEVLAPEHPWQQFREPYPDTVQNQNIEIKDPKRFYKRDRRYRKYTPRML